LAEKIITFSDEIRERVNGQTRSIMSTCERTLPLLWSAVDQMPQHFVMSASGDIRDQHNNYVRAILARTAAKQVSLTLGLIGGCQ
jgi:hypothetical protein